MHQQQLSYASATAASEYSNLTTTAEKTRNALIIKFSKPSGSTDTLKELKHQDYANYIFDVLDIDVDQVIGVDFSTGRPDHKEVLFKKEANTDEYVGVRPDFKGYRVEVIKPLYGSTRITFKNVPLYIPDAELIHLIGSYAKMDKEEILSEKVSIKTEGGKVVNVKGTTRYAFATIPANKHLRRYYLLEGPLTTDTGRRVIVEHAGQERQCANCLNWARQCPGMGDAKECREQQPRTPLWRYMEMLREVDHYESLKVRYANKCNKDDFESRRDYYRNLSDNEDEYEEAEMEGVKEGDSVPKPGKAVMTRGADPVEEREKERIVEERAEQLTQKRLQYLEEELKRKLESEKRQELDEQIEAVLEEKEREHLAERSRLKMELERKEKALKEKEAAELENIKLKQEIEAKEAEFKKHETSEHNREKLAKKEKELADAENLRLTKKIEEKEAKIAEKEASDQKLKEENNRSRSEVKRLNENNSSLKRDLSIGRKNILLNLKKLLKEGDDWEAQKYYCSAMVANIMDSEHFHIHPDSGEVTVVPGEKPWAKLRTDVDLQQKKSNKQSEERFKELQELIKEKLKGKLSPPNAKRERSKTSEALDNAAKVPKGEAVIQGGASHASQGTKEGGEVPGGHKESEEVDEQNSEGSAKEPEVINIEDESGEGKPPLNNPS